MMREHLSAQHLERYHERTMSPAELLTLYAHLARCAACRERVGEVEQMPDLFTSLRADLHRAAEEEPDHLSYQQLEAYVDGQTSEVDREIVESHLALCPPCAEEVGDLRAFRSQMITEAGNKETAISTPNRWERFVAFGRVPAHWIPLQIAGTAAAAVLLVWLVTRPLQTQVANLRAQVGQLQQTNEALQHQVSTVADQQRQLAQLQQAQIESLPGATSPVIVALRDGGGLVTLDRQGHLTGLDSIPSSAQQAIKAVLTTERVKAPPSLAELIGEPRMALLGSPDKNASSNLLSPVGTVVETDRPTFRWQPLAGAASYTVTVYDSRLNKIAFSPSLSETEWRVPQPLERGRRYLWQVAAVKGGQEIILPAPPAPEAKFKVLEQAQADELERAKQGFADSHLLLGVLSARAGLLDEAEREFQALLEANPRSAVAQKLLRSVKARRHPR